MYYRNYSVHITCTTFFFCLNKCLILNCKNGVFNGQHRSRFFNCEFPSVSRWRANGHVSQSSIDRALQYRRTDRRCIKFAFGNLCARVKNFVSRVTNRRGPRRYNDGRRTGVQHNNRPVNTAGVRDVDWAIC